MTHIPPWGDGTGRACGAAIIGAAGHLVEACAVISNGPAVLRILGLPDDGIRETRDRIRAAIINSGLWPGRTITVTLLPASLPKHASALDLAMAVAALTAAGPAPAATTAGCVFTAELGLDGSLRPVRGVLPAVIAAAAAGCTRAVVAPEDAAEAALVPGVTVIPCWSLRAVHAWLCGDPFPGQPEIPASTMPPAPAPAPGLAGLAVPPLARCVLEASAAGGHHLCLTGLPGAAIPALAAGAAALLPPLSLDEAVEVAAVHSVAGLLEPGHSLITQPPYRAPHHTATRAAILGGGLRVTRPGEASLAHRGVLFLQDAPEFARDVLAALRQPLHDGEVTVARGGVIARFPAKFTLIASMPPCPCAGQAACSCSPLQARRYRGRFTAELGTYIGLWLHVTRPGPAAAGTADAAGDADAISVGRVAAARDRARHRLAGTPWQLNADVPGAALRRSYQPEAEALAPIRRAADLGEISARAAHQVIRVAWTLADLAGNARPGADECGQALAFQLGVSQ